MVAHMKMKRKLVAIKEREFTLEQAPFTGELRFVHILESGADGNNVKRQFDDKLFAQGLPKGNVRLVQPSKIILSPQAYQVWQKYKEQEPGRKKRTLPEHRQFNLDKNHNWIHNLSNKEIARVVAGTISTNAKEVYNIDIDVTYDKNNNIVCIDNHSLANYLNAIKNKKPILLENPEYQQYINQTLLTINNISKNLSRSAFKEFTHYSNAKTISSFGIHAQKRSAVSQNKSMHKRSVHNEQTADELIPFLIPAASAA